MAGSILQFAQPARTAATETPAENKGALTSAAALAAAEAIGQQKVRDEIDRNKQKARALALVQAKVAMKAVAERSGATKVGRATKKRG